MAFDLDDEELRATKIMNGTLKEDRKDIEKLIEELTRVNPTNLSKEGLKLFNKINEIIDRNKELEQIEAEHQKENGELRQGIIPSYEETIAELEQQLFDSVSNCKIIDLIKRVKENEKQLDLDYVDNNFIHKSKIIEKIECLKETKRDLLQLPSYIGRSIALEDCDEKIQILQELL